MASSVLHNVGHGTSQLAVCPQTPRIKTRVDDHIAVVCDADARRHVLEHIGN